MKILHIINDLGTGGAEKLLKDILPILNRKKGIKADLLLLTDRNNVFETNLLKNNVSVDVVKYKNIYNPFNIKEIANYINNRNYNIVHSHLFQSKYWTAFSKKFVNNEIKYVTTEHSTTNRRRNFSFLSFIENYIYAKYDLIISISKKTQSNLINWISGTDKSKFTVIENGIDVNKFFEAAPYKEYEINPKLSSDNIIITMVSSFRKPKDHLTLIKAFENLNERYHLLLVGKGNLKNEYKKRVAELKISDRVHFLGYRNDIERILKTSDIIVLSSYYEGMSLSSIEGMASGKPFIASKVEGLKEVVEGAGLLFEQGDFNELNNLIKKLSNDTNLYYQISKRCINRAKNYDIKKMVDELIYNYKKII